MKTPYALSDNYELLWNLIQEGNRLAGWAYARSDGSKVAPRVVQICIPHDDPDGRYVIGYPGYGFEGRQFDEILTEKEAFICDCTEARLAYIVPPAEMPRIDPTLGASFAKQLLANLGFVVGWGDALDPISLSFTEAHAATIRTVLSKMMAISPQMREIVGGLRDVTGLPTTPDGDL